MEARIVGKMIQREDTRETNLNDFTVRDSRKGKRMRKESRKLNERQRRRDRVKPEAVININLRHSEGKRKTE